VSPNFVSVKYF